MINLANIKIWKITIMQKRYKDKNELGEIFTMCLLDKE